MLWRVYLITQSYSAGEEIPLFCVNQMFITVATKIRHPTLPASSASAFIRYCVLSMGSCFSFITLR